MSTQFTQQFHIKHNVTVKSYVCDAADYEKSSDEQYKWYSILWYVGRNIQYDKKTNCMKCTYHNLKIRIMI